MNPDRIRAAIRTLYPDEMTPTARNVLERILDDEHEAVADATASSMSEPKEPAMTENANAESIPAEHDEEICSGGSTMCRECYDSADAGQGEV